MEDFDIKGAFIQDAHRDNLQASLDYEDSPEYPYACLLYTPYMSDTNNHYHIQLTRESVIKLRDWLNEVIPLIKEE